MLLAADVGGTKTFLGLFRPAPRRPLAIEVASFATRQFPTLIAMVERFLAERPGGRPAIDAACIGVAGPVIDQRAEMTNVGSTVDGAELASRLGLERCRLLNDLVAVAHAVPVLDASELHSLQDGHSDTAGNAGLIAAGTGLGQAFLFNDGQQLVPAPSEAGHADFAARTPREWALVSWLTGRRGRADVEQVVSGIGLGNLYRFTHGTPCVEQPHLDETTLPSVLSAQALSGRCARCREALDCFVEAYGAEAGNLALRCVATRGVYIGGGIAPRILPALETGAFMRAFTNKPPMDEFLRRVPVRVILNPQAGLLGAATVANREALVALGYKAP